MKQITIIFLWLCLLGNTEKKQTPNEIVLNHAISCMGKKVGDGMCETLVDSCLSRSNKEWKEKYNYGCSFLLANNDTLLFISDCRYGKMIKIDDLIPGDIALYSSTGLNLHVSILYEKTKDFLFFLDQNADLRYGENSHVGINSKSIDTMKHINVVFFRPY